MSQQEFRIWIASVTCLASALTAAEVWLVTGFMWHPWVLWGALGFDFDEVLMVCMGMAAVAYVAIDFKRERETQAYLVALHEDLGRIKSMIGWDLPHALGERVTKLEALVPDDLADRLAGVEHEDDIDKRVASLEAKDCSERVTALEHATAHENEHTIAERVLVLETKRAPQRKRS